MAKADLAVIGGTGVYQISMLEKPQQLGLETRYGRVDLLVGDYQGRRVAFLARHGRGHSVPPHLINYRANIQALRDLKVKKIIATAAVGSLNEKMAPCDFVLVDQFLDFTKTRKSTFYEGRFRGVEHVDVTNAYCSEIRDFLYNTAQELNLKIHPQGCYVCTEGPRFETAAEVRMFQQLGGDVVGMTSVPEVVLAREVGIPYAAVCLVTNYAAGISTSPLSHQEVVEVTQKINQDLSRLLKAAVGDLPLKKGDSR